jgi:sortase A
MPKRKTKKKTKELAGTRVHLSFKKHIMPPLVGLLVAVAVFGFFNSGWISARVAYYLNSRKLPQQLVIPKPTTAKVDKNAPSKLYIDNINVTAPVIFSVTTVDQALFLQALHDGVVHYPGTAAPGQVGNVVIFGHSSGQWWAPGNYKFVFTLLDKLKSGDKIYVDYQGIRYTYRAYESRVVAPTDLSVLNQGSDNILTLITCTPVGTNAKRLIVLARQIDPAPVKPTQVKQAAKLPGEAQGKLPGNPPSFWRSLRELF